MVHLKSSAPLFASRAQATFISNLILQFDSLVISFCQHLVSKVNLGCAALQIKRSLYRLLSFFCDIKFILSIKHLHSHARLHHNQTNPTSHAIIPLQWCNKIKRSLLCLRSLSCIFCFCRLISLLSLIIICKFKLHCGMHQNKRSLHTLTSHKLNFPATKSNS